MAVRSTSAILLDVSAIGLICLAFFLITLGTFRYLRRRAKMSPGPSGYPFLGMPSIMSRYSIIHKTFTSFGKVYGKVFQFKVFGRRSVVLRSASVVETALHNVNITNRSEPFFQRYVFNGKDFAFADYSKRVPDLRTVFHSALYWKWDTRNQTDDILTREVTCLTQTLNGYKGDNLSMDAHIKDLMTNIYSAVLIGDTLPDADPDRSALWDLVDQLYLMLEPSVDLPLRVFPFLRHLPGKHGRIFRRAIEARDIVSRQFFDSQKSTFEEGRVRGLVDVCLQIQADEIREKGDTWLSDDYIKGIMYDTVAAGMTEMMKSLRMLVLLMCHDQTVQSRVQAEIDSVIGDDFPNASHQREMPYTQAVIFEMLRYVSQTPLAIPHKSNKDIMLNGYLIEKNSGIFPNIWGIHHDEEVWGDPWVFRPERFLDENNRLISKHHKTMKSFIPFSVGKRRCPGENFAMSRIFVIFSALLQKINFTGPEGEDLPSVDPRLYTNKYPMVLPVYTCRALPRDSSKSS